MNLISLKMLTGEKGKYFSMIIGVAFASLLMTQSMALFVGLMTRTIATVQNAGIADIWVVDPKSQYVDDVKNVPDTQLYRVRSVEGVKWAVPVYDGLLKVRLKNGSFETCLLLGLDDATLAGGPPTMLQGRLEDLRRTDAVIVDAHGAESRLANAAAEHGVPHSLRVGDSLELNDHRASVVGISWVTRSLLSVPVIYTTYSRALTFAPPERKMLSFVLVKVAPGAELATVCRRIARQTGLAAYTKDTLQSMTVWYYVRNTGIPITTGTAALLGLIVGIAVAGQAFYSFTQDNIRYFGALKAMGASNMTLLRMILLQAALVGVIGYGIGVGCATLYGFFARNTEVAFRITWHILVGSAAAVSLICMGSAAASIRRVMKLEPAIVFRG